MSKSCPNWAEFCSIIRKKRAIVAPLWGCFMNTMKQKNWRFVRIPQILIWSVILHQIGTQRGFLRSIANLMMSIFRATRAGSVLFLIKWLSKLWWNCGLLSGNDLQKEIDSIGDLKLEFTYKIDEKETVRKNADELSRFADIAMEEALDIVTVDWIYSD